MIGVITFWVVLGSFVYLVTRPTDEDQRRSKWTKTLRK